MMRAIIPVVLLLTGCAVSPQTAMLDRNGDGVLTPAELVMTGTEQICASTFIARTAFAAEVAKSDYLRRLDVLCLEMDRPATLVDTETAP